MDFKTILILLGIVAIALFCLWFFKIRKKISLPAVYLITGAPKTGKSAISLDLAKSQYRKNVFSWYVLKVLSFFLRRKCPMKPMFYTNMPVSGIRWNKLTKDIIERKVRIPPKSVLLIDEVSLLADSMLFNNPKLNAQLTLFVKLWGHYSHGGTMIVNTQSLKDCHYAFKRCTSRFLYIYSKRRFPFVTEFLVREMVYDADSEMVNTVNEDIEKSTMPLFVWNKVFKTYDCYYLSTFTDDLPMQVDYTKPILNKKDSLKVTSLVSYQDYSALGLITDYVSEKEVKQDEKTKAN